MSSSRPLHLIEAGSTYGGSGLFLTCFRIPLLVRENSRQNQTIKSNPKRERALPIQITRIGLPCQSQPRKKNLQNINAASLQTVG